MSIRLLKCVLFCLCLISPVAWAETFTWTGISDGFWSNAGNWSSGGGPTSVGTGVPGPLDDVIMTGDGTSPVLDVDPVVLNMEVRAGAFLSLQGRSLTIDGNLLHIISNTANDGITMNQSTDSLVVRGTATFTHTFNHASATTTGQFLDGTIFFEGDFVQTSGGGFTSGEMFAPAGTMVIFNGTTPQTVSFGHPAVSQSRFNDLRVLNSAGVTFNSNVALNGLLTLTSGVLNGQDLGGGVMIQSSDFVVLVDNMLPDASGGTYDVVNTMVFGNIVMDSDRTFVLSQNNLFVEPTFSLTLNGRSLDLGGDLRVQISNTTDDGLIMTQSLDSLVVRGDAVFTHTANHASATSENNFTDGNISFRGNFLQTNGGNATSGKMFTSTGTTVSFDGSVVQTVEFINPSAAMSRFERVIVNNTAGVNFVSNVFVDGVLSMGTGGQLTQTSGDAFFTNELPLTNAGYQIPRSRIAGAVGMSGERTIPNGGALFVDPGFSLNTSGHVLTVDGDLTVTISNTTGDGLIMTGSLDELIVNGTATFTHVNNHNSATSENNFLGGAIRFRGDFVQTFGGNATSGRIFTCAGTQVFFDGTAAQNVSFTHPGEALSRFNDVFVLNPAGVNFTSDVVVDGRLSVDGVTLTGTPTLNQSADFHLFYTNDLPDVGSGFYNVINSCVRAPIALTRDITLPSESSNLFVLSTEHLNLNGHALEVGGDLTVTISNTTADGLLMQHPADLLTVNGTTTFTHANNNGTATSVGNFSDGLMRLRGDFVQIFGGNATNGRIFVSTGTDVLFDGTAAQTVSFLHPGEDASRFDNVTFANAGGVTLTSDVYVDGQLTFDTPRFGGVAVLTQAATESSFYVNQLPNVTGGSYNVANTVVRGLITMTEPLTLELEGNDLIVPASESLTLGGQPLTVGGDLLVTISNTTSDGIRLLESTDRLTVNGTATFTHANNNGTATSEGNFTAGQIHFNGDFVQAFGGNATSGRMFVSTGTAVFFGGSQPQQIQFVHPGPSFSRFMDVTITNPVGVTTASNIQVEGSLFNDGALIVDHQLTVTGSSFQNMIEGVLAGGGVIDVTASSLISSGRIEPGPLGLFVAKGPIDSSLAITGDLTQGATGSTVITVEDVSSVDQLLVSGTAALGGDIEFVAGAKYNPAVGDAFTVLTYGSVIGDFDQYLGLDLGGGLSIETTLAAGQLDAEVVGTATFTWNNPGGGDWTTPGNWTPTGVPGPGDHARIDLDETFSVFVPDGTEIASLTLGSSNDFSQSLNVGGTLITTGEILVRGNAALLLTDSSIISASTTLGPPAPEPSLNIQGGVVATLGFNSIGVPVTIGPGGLLAVNGDQKFGGGSLSITGGVVNDGTISVNSGEFQGVAALTVEAGTLLNNALLQTLGGSDSNTAIVATIENDGQILLDSTATMSPEDLEVSINRGDFSFQGTLTLGALDNLSDGRFMGAGDLLLAGRLFNQGVLSPGGLNDDPLLNDRILNVTGDLVLDGSGTLELLLEDLGGQVVADQLNGTTGLTLAGNLEVLVNDAFDMELAGQAVITSTLLDGAFGEEILPLVPNGRRMSSAQTSTDFSLQVTPPQALGQTQIYAFDAFSGRLYSMHAANNELTTFYSLGVGEVHLATSPDGSRMLAAATDLGSVHVVDTADGALLGNVLGIAQPGPTAVTADSTRAWIFSPNIDGQPGFEIVELSSLESVDQMSDACFAGATGIAFHPTEAKAFVIKSNGDMCMVDTAALSVLDTFSLGQTLNDLVVLRNGSAVFAADALTGNLYRFDLSTLTAQPISVGGQPTNLALDDAGILYAAKLNQDLLVLDTFDNSFINQSFSTGTSIFDLVTNPPTGTGLFSDLTTQSLIGFSLDTPTVAGEDLGGLQQIVEPTVLISNHPYEVVNESEIRFGMTAYTASEADGTASIEVVRLDSGDNTVTVTVRDGLGGTAVPQQDYQSFQTTVTFEPGDSTHIVDVVLIDDAVVGDPGTVNLELVEGLVGDTLGEVVLDTAVLTITDFENGRVDFEQAEFSVFEDGEVAAIQVVRSNGTDGSLTFDFETLTGGTADAGADYIAVSDSFTMDPGQEELVVFIDILDDNIDEADETVFLQLQNPDGGIDTATLEIIDVEAGEAAFAAGFFTVDEDQGLAEIGLVRTGGTDSELSVQFQTLAGGTATAGEDYLVVNQTVFFEPGQTTAIVSVPLLDDAIEEVGETVFLGLFSPDATKPLDTAVLTINDVESGLVVFADPSPRVLEDAGSISIALNRIQGSNGSLTVQFSTQDITAEANDDYMPLTQILTFESGQTSATVTLQILDDNLLEGDETLRLTLSSPEVLAKGDVATAVLTIEDVEAGRIEFESSSYLAEESQSTAPISLTRVGGDDGALSVLFRTVEGGTADAGDDYQAVTSSVTFADGQTSATVEVPLIPDELVEDAETVFLAIEDPEQTLGDGGRSAILTIVDSQDPGDLSFSVAEISVNESAPDPAITVTRSAGFGDVSVLVSVLETVGATNGVDYEFLSTTLNFEAGQESAQFVFPILNDSVQERLETVTLQLSNPTGGAGIGSQNTLEVRILDNDTSRVSWRSSSKSVSEAAGTLTLTAQLSARSEIRVAAPFSVSGGVAGLDYNLSSSSFVFTPGQTTDSVTLEIIDNNLDQETRRLVFDLDSGRVETEQPTRLTVDIEDNDEPVEVNWLGSDVTQTEGRSVTLTAGLSRAVDATQVVTLSVGGTAGDDDVVLSASELVFAPGAEQASLTVSLSDDTVQELDETLTLTLTGGDALIGADADRTITITDNDQPSVSWATAGQTVTEDDTAKRAFTVNVVARLTGTSVLGLEVPYFIGGAATPGSDHDLSAGVLRFDPGSNSTTLSFQILGDTIEESTENITLRLLDGAVPLGGIIEHQILIEDNDLNQAPDTTIVTPQAGGVFRVGEQVGFSASGTDPQGDTELSFKWEIRASTGPGLTREGPGFSNVFDSTGIYEVSCYAIDSQGNEDRSPARIKIEIVANEPPVVAITQPQDSAITVAEGASVDFLAEASDPDDAGKTVDLVWFLISRPQALTPGPSFSQTFNERGNFTVAVRATDDEGSTASDFVTVRVVGPDRPILPGLLIVQPNNGQSFNLGEPIDFIGATRDDAPIPEGLTPAWDLGDGRVLSGAVQNGVTYAKPGRYTAAFLLQDSGGNRQVQRQVRIFIEDAGGVPLVDFNIPFGWRLEPTSTAKRMHAGELFLEAVVEDNQGYENLDYFWDFGDGRTSRQASPGRIGYSEPGLYVITLYAVTPAGVQSPIQTRSILVVAGDDGAMEPNNNFDEAPRIRAGQYENLAIADDDESDVFRVAVTRSGQRLVLDLDSDDVLEAAIYDSNRVLLETRTVARQGNLQLRGLEPGEYFISVKAAPGAKRMGLSFSMGITVLEPALYFPDIRVDETFDTELGIVNPTNSEASLDATAYDTGGNVVATAQLILPARGRCHETAFSLFGNAAARIAWVRVDAGNDLVGYSRTSDRDFQKLYAVSAAKQLSSELFVPHIAEQVDQWETRCAVVNGGDLGSDSVIEAPDRDIVLDLEKGFAADRFDFLDRFDGSLPAGDAWATLRDTNQQTTLAGVEVFGTIDGSQVVAGLELTNIRQNNPNFTFSANTLYFTHVANDTQNFWTGIALVNLSSAQQAVRITGYNAAGDESGSVLRTLAGGAKIVEIADTFLAGVGSAAEVAWFRVEADSDIVGFELFGTFDGERMAGLEASTSLQRELCYPFIDTDPGVVHGVSIVNAGNNAATLSLTLYDNAGNELAVQNQSLASNQKFTVTIESMVADAQLGEDVTPGWLGVASDQPVAGFELFLNEEAGKAQMGAVTAQ